METTTQSTRNQANVEVTANIFLVYTKKMHFSKLLTTVKGKTLLFIHKPPPPTLMTHIKVHENLLFLEFCH